jgi:hypothetical protein
MNQAIRAKFEEVKILAFDAMDDTYDPVVNSSDDPAPFLHPIRLLVIQNETDVTLVYSFDGITDHLYLPTYGQIVFDFTTNSMSSASGLYIAQGTQVYVRYLVGDPALAGYTTVSAVYGDY